MAGTTTSTSPGDKSYGYVTSLNGRQVVIPAAVLTDSSGNEIDPVAAATSTARLLSSAATTNATGVKAAAGTVVQISGSNLATAARYLKLYDKASAPTVGTDTPRKTYYLPPGQAFVLDCRDYYATGIAYAITGAAADADTTAIASGDIVCLNVDYI